MQIVQTERVYQSKINNPEAILEVKQAIESLNADDFGNYELFKSPLGIALMRNFSAVENAHTSFGIYYYNHMRKLVVAVDKNYADFEGGKYTYIVADGDDIDFSSNDPLRKLITTCLQMKHKEV